GKAVSVQGFAIEQLRLRPDISLTAAAFEVHALRHPDFQIDSVKGEALVYKEGEGLALGALKLTDGTLHLTRNKLGQWVKPAIPLRSSKKGSAFQVRTERIRVGNVRAFILDHGASPTFQADVLVREAEIDQFSSPSLQPARFKIEGQLGRFSLLRFEGEAVPVLDPPTFNLKGRIRGLSLPILSPYVRRMLGYEVITGQMDGDFALRSQKGKLKGSGELTLRRLQISLLDARQAKVFTQDLAIPLESALDLLRDDRGDIRLHLETSGDLSNPQFDLSDAFRQAMARALIGGALAYLKYAIQPYGTLIAGAELAWKAGKKLFQIQLDPILFPPGRDAFNPAEALPYLKKVSAMMKKSSKLRLSLCGISASDDLIAVKNPDAALALAQRRAEHVKAAIEQLGVAGDRLFICRPQLEEKAGGKPRVAMHIE
ncbi:DUF748 domain-containing protein, partial [Candidatus Parcubacteria bacterium]